MEYNLNDDFGSFPHLTDRIIKASTGTCYQYSVGIPTTIDSTDGIQAEFVMPFYNATFNGSLPIPRPDAAFDATTYIWNGTLAPQNETVQTCGPRCVYLYAFQSQGIQTKRPNTMFQCPITIGEVTSSSPLQDAHKVPDDIARLAAASIALVGRYTNPKGSDGKVWTQYQLYPWE